MIEQIAKLIVQITYPLLPEELKKYISEQVYYNIVLSVLHIIFSLIHEAEKPRLQAALLEKINEHTA